MLEYVISIIIVCMLFLILIDHIKLYFNLITLIGYILFLIISMRMGCYMNVSMLISFIYGIKVITRITDINIEMKSTEMRNNYYSLIAASMSLCLGFIYMINYSNGGWIYTNDLLKFNVEYGWQPMSFPATMIFDLFLTLFLCILLDKIDERYSILFLKCLPSAGPMIGVILLFAVIGMWISTKWQGDIFNLIGVLFRG